MFQPQPTPYALFAYGALPEYTYHQQAQRSGPGTPLGGANAGSGRLQAGGAGAGHNGGRTGFGGGVGASGAGSTGPLVVSGPPGLPEAGAGASPLLFTSPAFNSGPDAGHFHSSFHTSTNDSLHSPVRINNARIHRRRNRNMSDAAVGADLAAQQDAARDYQPQLEGPLVGQRTPSHAITEEYAKADPVYVQKTVALPQTYSHYRPIQGDGNCGWRAIAFSYFETLIQLGNVDILTSERNRLASYPIIGHAEYIYEDMREEFVEAFDTIYSALQNQQQNPMDVLVRKFNDPECANHILYYLRLLASSWLKTDPEASEYAAFIPEDSGIVGYCDNNIDLPGREIEHIGIMVLYNLLLKPTGMVLEIAYLDRSPSPEVNTYRTPSEANGQDISTLGPIIYLLFRPDHYDILYRHPLPPSAPVAPLDIQVHRVGAFSHDHQTASHTPSLEDFTGPVDMSALSIIPGLGFSAGPSGISAMGGISTGSPLDSYQTPSPLSPWMSSQYSNDLPLRQQHQHQQEEEEEAIAAAAPPVSALALPLRRLTPPVRFSEYCHAQVMDNESWREPAFSTSTFKNSHYNKAHYNNPNFQPEEYRPDLEETYYEATRPGRHRRSH